jgi:carboxymethylenebutenolidase
MSPDLPDGHLSVPPAGSASAVLVLHAWWGLNETIRAFCARLAECGLVAFARDLYHGNVTDTIAGAEALSRALDADRAKADVARAAQFLTNLYDQSKQGLAVIGFSLGAWFALDLSVTDHEHVRRVVTFYGTGPGDYMRSRASYVGHFAESDPYEPRVEVDKLEAAIRRAGRPVSFFHYPGTGHWFFEPDRTDAYKAEAAGLAWDRSLEFLKRPLEGA